MRHSILLLAALWLAGCAGAPTGATPPSRFGVPAPIALPLPETTIQTVLADFPIQQLTSPAGRTLKWGLKPIAGPLAQINRMLEHPAMAGLEPGQPTVIDLSGMGTYTALLREDSDHATLWLGTSNSRSGRLAAITYTAPDRGTLLWRTPTDAAGAYALRLAYDAPAGQVTADLAIENRSAGVRSVMHWELAREGSGETAVHTARLAAVDATLASGELDALGLSLRLQANGEGAGLVGNKDAPDGPELVFVTDTASERPEARELFFDASLNAIEGSPDASAEWVPADTTMPASYPVSPMATNPFDAPEWAFPE